jgi:amidase
VERLLAAGAEFVGKAQTDELAFSLMGQNSHFPYPINPAAPDRVTGGSSSGSAAAVAGKLADIALGSDTGGSIRAPASFCGLVGLRSTHGRIPLKGIMPLAPSLDTIGWFARDIELYDRVGAILLGDDAREFTLTKLLYMPVLEQLLLGEAETDAYRAMFAEVRPHFTSLKAASQPTLSIDELYLVFRHIQGAEAWATHGGWISSGDRKLGPGVADRFAFGAEIAADLVASQRVRRAQFTQELEKIIGNDAVLALPTVPGAAPLAKEPFETLQAYREQALRLLCLSVLSGLPQITLPLGQVQGAPFGISFIGPRGSDRALIGLARNIIGKRG